MVVDGARLETGDGLACCGSVGCARSERCRQRRWRLAAASSAEPELQADLGLGAGELLGGLDGGAVGADDLHAEEVAGGVFLEADHHGLRTSRRTRFL